MTIQGDSLVSSRIAVALGALLASNAASFVLFPEMHREHHEKLGVSRALESALPALMGAMSLSLLASRNRAVPRPIAGGVVAAYYTWASSTLLRGGEPALAGYGLGVAGVAASLVPHGIRPPRVVRS